MQLEQSATMPWDLRGLPDFAVFPYVVATDGVHSPTTPLYAARSVLPQPELIAQIDVQNPDSEEAGQIYRELGEAQSAKLR